jgi:hypothetical protein
MSARLLASARPKRSKRRSLPATAMGLRLNNAAERIGSLNFFGERGQLGSLHRETH